MKEKEIIRSLFDRLRPAIIAKLLNPEDYYVRWGVAQLVVPFNAEEAKILSPEEQFTAHPSDFRISGMFTPTSQSTFRGKHGRQNL